MTFYKMFINQKYFKSVSKIGIFLIKISYYVFYLPLSPTLLDRIASFSMIHTRVVFEGTKEVFLFPVKEKEDSTWAGDHTKNMRGIYSYQNFAQKFADQRITRNGSSAKENVTKRTIELDFCIDLI